MYLQLILSFAVCVFLLWRHFAKQIKNADNLPPGPLRFPFFGTIPQVAWSAIKQGRRPPPFVSLREMGDKYGPIVSFQFGLMYSLVVNDYDVAKEILCSDSWTGRHFDEWFQQRSWGIPYGILFAGGEEWKEMRRFTLRTLRDFGFGRNKSQESVMAEEVAELTSTLEANIDREGGIVPMKQFFTISVLNVLWSMVTGTRFPHDDAKLKQLNRLGSELIRTTPVGGNMANAYPFLVPILGKEARQKFGEFHTYFRELLHERRARSDYKNDQRDFVEVFLKEIDDHRGKAPNYYTDDQFVIVLLDLFLAGSETTSNTLEFALLYMILNPEIQSRVQAEIDSVVGPSRPPTANDKPNMPYTEATLLEIQRFANVLPIDSRSAVEDTKISGYNVSKGTPAVINLHAVHFSKKLWSNPEEFDPARFLDKDNNVVNATKIMPFGAGKRVCIGEAMARLTLFTYFTNLLQRYRFSVVRGQRVPCVDPVLGFTLSPEEYSVQIERR